MASTTEKKARRILVCDDDRNIARLLQVHLERYGHGVDTSFDGVDGLHKVRTNGYQLVILDVMMPELDGFEVLKEIRSNPETAHLPVMMLTARSEDADVFKGYHYGADLYLTKPFELSELTSFVRAMLN